MSAPEFAAAASPSETTRLVMSRPPPTAPEAFLPMTKKRVVLSFRSWMLRASTGTPRACAASSAAIAAAPGSVRASSTAFAVLAVSTNWACGRWRCSQARHCASAWSFEKTFSIFSSGVAEMRAWLISRYTCATAFRSLSTKPSSASRTEPSVEFSIGMMP